MIPLEDLVVRDENATIKPPCGHPAPLAMNGSAYVGCQLDSGHDGDQHEVIIRWARG